MPPNYYFELPDPALTKLRGTPSYDTMLQVLPPPDFDAMNASDAQLEKYQFPRYTHDSPQARQKYLSKPLHKFIGAVPCPGARGGGPSEDDGVVYGGPDYLPAPSGPSPSPDSPSADQQTPGPSDATPGLSPRAEREGANGEVEDPGSPGIPPGPGASPDPAESDPGDS